jgi:hypothetical protein
MVVVADVNGDGRLDLVARFLTELTGFQSGDTVGYLNGFTRDGRPLYGEDSIQTVPDKNGAPVVEKKSATVSEGEMLTLSEADLSATDADGDDAALIFTVKSVPDNGSLKKNDNALHVNDTLTQQDIWDGKISYTHDDSNTASDSFKFTVEDPEGKKTGVETFSITVTAVDDDAPEVGNKSATVGKGATLTLSGSQLSATDADSDDDALIFTLKSAPANGQVNKDGSALAQGGTFTQQDILEGKVSYTDDGSDTTSDSFKFMVKDPAGNETGEDTFSITVTNELMVGIDIIPGKFPNVIIPERQGRIPVAILSTEDFDAPGQVDVSSLTFGRTGDEDSLFRHPRKGPIVVFTDVNNDMLPDLVTWFETRLTGFQPGDEFGTLKGRTVTEQSFEGRDSIQTSGSRTLSGNSQGGTAAGIGSDGSADQGADAASRIAAVDLLFWIEASGTEAAQVETERPLADSVSETDLRLLAAARTRSGEAALDSAVVDRLFTELGER